MKLEPVFSATYASFNPILRNVRIVELKYPRLPDSYYQPGNKERSEKVEFELPEIPRFSLDLVRPDILGIRPERLTASVCSRKRRLDVSRIRIDWPDRDFRMYLDGFTYIDLDQQRVYGEVNGEARQSHIRPLLVTLDVPVALPYMDGFTGVTQPVPAFCSWDVDLSNNDFRLKLKLHPTLGFYNGVPLRRADGEIGLHVYTRDGYLNFNTTVGPITAFDPKGRMLDGTVVVRGTNDVVHVEFDASSGLNFNHLLAVVDYLNDGTLDCLECDAPPNLTIHGILATDVSRQADNNLQGTVKLDKGRFFSIPVNDVALDYAYVGDEISFTNVKAKGKTGGEVKGKATIRVPGLDAERSDFSLDIDYANGSLDELADVLSVDFGEKSGRVDGHVTITAPMTTNLYPRMCGEGSIKITDGKLAQMPLFSGLTTILADKVPGVGYLVNQSQASADFTINNGVFKSDNIYIEGGLVSVKAQGTYDIPADKLDFTVRVRFLKNENLLSKLVHPVTWAFTKLLMEFKVEGSMNDPKWTYVSLIDRVL